MAVWMPVTVVPTSLATVAIDTFMTELSRVIRNCPAARVSRTSPVPLAGASGARVLTASASISSQPHRPQSWAAAEERASPPRDEQPGCVQHETHRACPVREQPAGLARPPPMPSGEGFGLQPIELRLVNRACIQQLLGPGNLLGGRRLSRGGDVANVALELLLGP